MLPLLYMYLFPQCELVLQNHQTSITSWASDNTPGCLHHRKHDKLPLDGPISLSADLRPYKPSGLFLLEHILVSFTWYQQKYNKSFCKEYWPITSYTPYQFLKFCWEFCFNSCENEEFDPSDGYLSQLQFWILLVSVPLQKILLWITQPWGLQLLADTSVEGGKQYQFIHIIYSFRTANKTRFIITDMHKNIKFILITLIRCCYNCFIIDIVQLPALIPGHKLSTLGA